jgi:hypothetical protein
MQKSKHFRHAVTVHDYCDLLSRPCRPTINLVQAMMHAVESLGEAMLDDFGLEAEIAVETCPRICGLKLTAEGPSATVARDSVTLASTEATLLTRGAFRMSELVDLTGSAPKRGH